MGNETYDWCLACRSKEEPPAPVSVCSLPPDWGEEQELEQIHIMDDFLDKWIKRLRKHLNDGR